MNEFISIKAILDRLLRHPLMQDLQLEAAIDYTVDFMRIVGCPEMFEGKVESLPVTNYRADLKSLGLIPYKILGVRYGNVYLKYANQDFHPALNPTPSSPSPASVHHIIHGGFDFAGITTKDIVLQDSMTKYMGTFEFVSNMRAYYNSRQSNDGHSNGYTYKIQGSCLFTNIQKGDIDVAYIGIPVDEEGFPMIVNNSSYLRALELYIKKQWFTILFDMGKIQGPVLQNVQQEYAWAVGDCESEFNRMTVDQAEYFYSTMKNIHNESYGFKYLGG